ncbi:hypothetical protein AciX9_3638 [Granulicella tundricola MP5ACTX9]|uniref:Uncharacterized protein n=2 Tax=Granulicella TaxID=940557 RepID=E8X5L4_GRATM|nr:hypothetical protein AciX9_3638 [Granulicella tundricola MP5ACTX9]
MMTWTGRLVGLGLIACGVAGGLARAQDAKELLATLAQNEQTAGEHRGHYTYVAEERSDRTGGRLWTEKVVETSVGRVRFLLKEDGQPLNQEREAQERGRLAQDVANPDAFAKREAAQANDEAHAKQMLGLLQKAYLFDPPAVDAEFIRIQFRPNPDYKPASMEERVLHGMTGLVVIDRRMTRLRELDGRLASDVGLGFGPLAVVKAGSNFVTLREHVEGPDWKTESVHTDIAGRAFMLKSLARKIDAKRWGYQKVKDGLSVAEGVALVEE